MGHDVHIHVCFACSANDKVAALAARHLPAVSECREATWFLEELAKRRGINPGPKGGLSLWGMVGNYTEEQQFIDILRPFWYDLLSGVPGGPLDFERVLVFVEHEQNEQALAFEIYLEPGDDLVRLAVRRHECPFSWRQF